MPLPDVRQLIQTEFFAKADEVLGINKKILETMHWREKHNERAIKKCVAGAENKVEEAKKEFAKGLSQKLFDAMADAQEALRALHAAAFQYYGSMGVNIEEYTAVHRGYHEHAEAVLKQLTRHFDREKGQNPGKSVEAPGFLQKLLGHFRIRKVELPKRAKGLYEELRIGKSIVRLRIINHYKKDDVIGDRAVNAIDPLDFARVPRVARAGIEAALRNNKHLLPSSLEMNVSLEPAANAVASLRLDSTPSKVFVIIRITPGLLAAAEQGKALSDDPIFYKSFLHELGHFFDWHLSGEAHLNPEMDLTLYRTLKEVLGKEPSIAALWLASTLERARNEAYAEQTKSLHTLERDGEFYISEYVPDWETAKQWFEKYFSRIENPATYITSLQKLRSSGETRLFGQFMLFLIWLERLWSVGEVRVSVPRHYGDNALAPKGLGAHLSEAKFSLSERAVNNLDAALQKIRLQDWVTFLVDFGAACEYFDIKSKVTLEQIKRLDKEI